ncbi:MULTISPECIES: lipopolysaccharide 1,6-galactosyltransferase [unclassified Brenneria]|uniref:lipopolysaccharide 1,6-galactosyltransferase n=1 Tax=unclassified Brenneria TaxID=2634434 RepID=UPI0018F0D61F|nr:lipopolysaccharide 1,6-galactosyltransferase [Brenneria sp. L3-3C-1]MBJ7223405.1 lipopolysaccharide 1,6-galactosyltransferase [Brenneria sp. L3-3C-1]MEE3644645.1 lipopolysaccharide 1,6-galactosyltransferase [Brenneria sp. L3_3C_1]
MNILFVGEAVSGFGGIETVIQKVTGFLTDDPATRHHYTLYFLCRDDRMDKSWLAGKKAVYSRSGIKISFFRRLKHIYALSRYIEKNNLDIIIAFDSPSCLIAARAIKYSNRNIRLISWIHYSLDHKKYSERVLEADYHLAISSGIQQQLVNRGVPAEKIYTIFNPVTPTEIVIPRPESTQPASFLYVGRIKFEGQKRLKDLLDTLSRLEGDWVFHAVGDGSDLKICQAYAQQLGISQHIHWHGWQANPWEYIRTEIKTVSSLLLTSSFEGFGMVLAEAMSYGIYCISSDCPSGPADIIKNDVNGKLYPPKETERLQSTLQDIINHQTLPSTDVIKTSISNFYDEKYYQEIKKIIQAIINL